MISDGKKFGVRTDCLSESEIIAILIWFNLSGFKCFKHFYPRYQQNLRQFFPKIPCYERFFLLQKKGFVLINLLMRFFVNSSEKTDTYYIDSTFLETCKNKRIYGLHRITKVRQNMKPKPSSATNKFLLKKRGIIETIFAN
jgi:hypothetical protein